MEREAKMTLADIVANEHISSVVNTLANVCENVTVPKNIEAKDMNAYVKAVMLLREAAILLDTTGYHNLTSLFED